MVNKDYYYHSMFICGYEWHRFRAKLATDLGFAGLRLVLGADRGRQADASVVQTVPSVKSVLGVLGLDGVDQVQSVVDAVGGSANRHLTTRAALLRVRYLYVRS